MAATVHTLIITILAKFRGKAFRARLPKVASFVKVDITVNGVDHGDVIIEKPKRRSKSYQEMDLVLARSGCKSSR